MAAFTPQQMSQKLLLFTSSCHKNRNAQWQWLRQIGVIMFAPPRYVWPAGACCVAALCSYGRWSLSREAAVPRTRGRGHCAPATAADEGRYRLSVPNRDSESAGEREPGAAPKERRRRHIRTGDWGALQGGGNGWGRNEREWKVMRKRTLRGKVGGYVSKKIQDNCLLDGVQWSYKVVGIIGWWLKLMIGDAQLVTSISDLSWWRHLMSSVDDVNWWRQLMTSVDDVSWWRQLMSSVDDVRDGRVLTVSVGVWWHHFVTGRLWQSNDVFTILVRLWQHMTHLRYVSGYDSKMMDLKYNIYVRLWQ